MEMISLFIRRKRKRRPHQVKGTRLHYSYYVVLSCYSARSLIGLNIGYVYRKLQDLILIPGRFCQEGLPKKHVQNILCRGNAIRTYCRILYIKHLHKLLTFFSLSLSVSAVPEGYQFKTGSQIETATPLPLPHSNTNTPPYPHTQSSAMPRRPGQPAACSDKPCLFTSGP